MDPKLRINSQEAAKISALTKKHEEIVGFLPLFDRSAFQAVRIQIPASPCNLADAPPVRITLSPRTDHASPDQVTLEVHLESQLRIALRRALESEIGRIQDQLGGLGVEPG